MQQRWRRGLATFGIAAALWMQAEPGQAEPSADKVAAGQLVALVNQERAAAGIPPLGLSDVAIEVAEAWSGHMASTGVLAHNDAWFSAETKQRAGAAVAGENVAANVDVADAHRRLMASPQHRANILDPRFHQVGIGVVRGGDGRWWVTEDFLQLRVVQNTNDVVEPVAPPAPGPSPSPPPPPAPAPPATTPPAPPASAPSSESAPPAPVEPTTTAPSAAAPSSAETGDAGGGELARGAPATEAADGSGPSGGGIEVASGRGVVTPATRSDVVPPGLVALAVAAVLANATGIAHRRRRLLIRGKGGKITRS